ncbi:MAG: thermonuclease family protein [Proteobacteria bacterium]|nr:thermonuclease family protein [Pseudomonadota bacterium]MDA1012701.1 thermonuclease family protein [Pseudomonadota bacterium]
MQMRIGTLSFSERHLVTFLLIVFVGFCFEIPMSQSEVFRGEVVRIADGDTITVLINDGQKIKVRFGGIDTPEMDQPFGTEARDQLSRLIRGKSVICDCVKRDRYKRWVCKVLFDDLDVNWLLVRNGLAWWYRDYQKDQTQVDRIRYKEAEALAKHQRIGLWADDVPLPPWEWRRQRRAKRNAK